MKNNLIGNKNLSSTLLRGYLLALMFTLLANLWLQPSQPGMIVPDGPDATRMVVPDAPDVVPDAPDVVPDSPE